MMLIAIFVPLRILISDTLAPDEVTNGAARGIAVSHVASRSVNDPAGWNRRTSCARLSKEMDEQFQEHGSL